MKIQYAKFVLLVLCLAVCVELCRPDDVFENAKEKAREVIDDATEKSQTLSRWAYDRISE